MVNDIAVQEFVNAIKDTSVDTNKTYGATVSRIDGEGVVWVNIHGSGKETPTASTSTEVKRGDNVTVEWRNNKLYIGGNYSNPSAGMSTVAPAVNYFDSLYAKNISVESLNAAKAYIEDLTAKNITAENISADHAMIRELDVESMSAATAYIRDLTSENITAQNIIADHETVGTLDATYATITNLNAAKGRIDDLEANEAVVNDTLKATNAEVEYLSSDWISTDRLVLTGNNKNNYPPVQITETEFNVNKTAYWTKDGNNYTQCTASSVYDPDEQYYVRQTVKSIIEAINTANNTDPQVVISNDKLIAASMDVAELSAITADMGTLTAGKIQKGNNFINLNTVPASMEFKNASTWASATQGIQFDTQGNLNIKGTVNITGGNVPTNEELSDAIDGIEIGGRNLLIETGIAIDSNTSYANHTMTNTGADTKTRFELQLQNCNSSNSYVNMLTYTYPTYDTTGHKAFTFEVRNATQSNGYIRVKHNGGTADIGAEFKFGEALAVGDTATLSFDLDGCNPSVVGGLIVRNIKLEKGNKATDWTPAPEDVQAEIDAKKSIHTLNSAYLSTGATYASVLGWCEDGNPHGFDIDIVSTPVSNVKVGDAVRVKYFVNNMGSNGTMVYVVGTALETYGTTNPNVMTVKLGNINLETTVIDGGHILTGTIDANNVNISNLTVGAFGTSEQSKILNSEIEIDGRNLLIETGMQIDSGVASYINHQLSNIITDTKTAFSLQLQAYNGSTFESTIYDFGNISSTGKKEITFKSAAAVSAGKRIRFKHNGSAHDISVTFNLNESIAQNEELTLSFVVSGYNPSTVGGLVIRDIKLEKGNRATGWSLAPEDVTTIMQTSAKQINTYSRSFVKSSWESYGENGHTESWNSSGYDNSHIRVGDTAYLTGSVSDNSGQYAVILGTVTSVSSTAVIMKSICVTYNSALTEKYVTHIDNAGIEIHPLNSRNNRILLNGDGMYVVSNGDTRAFYGDKAYLYGGGGTYPLTRVGSDGTFIFDANGKQLGYYGTFTRIGDYDSKNVRIDGDGVKINSSADNVIAQYGDTTRIGKSANANVEVQNSKVLIKQGTTPIVQMFGAGTGTRYGSLTFNDGGYDGSDGITGYYNNGKSQVSVNSMGSSEGYVTINAAKPGQTAYLRLLASSSASITSSVAITVSSDRRLKEHVSYVGEEADDFIRNLKPAHFKRDGSSHLGFYAQDVENNDKWGACVINDGEFKALDYTGLIAPLVAYCQHLEKRIEELERSK